MKKLVACLLILVLSLCLSTALADYYGTALIDGRDADRVHLRAHPSAYAESLGLFYSGVRVQCLSDPESQWVQVQLGNQTGFMLSTYLVHESQPFGVVTSLPAAQVISPQGGWVNLRATPSLSADVAARLNPGTSLTILGETADHWCYVRTEDWLHGYMMSAYVSGSASAAPTAFPANLSFADLPTRWTWLSGAGAWSTELTLAKDGSFEGYYHDTEMGETGPSYPHGTVYECRFSGKFSPLSRVDQWEYRATVSSFQVQNAELTETIIDGVRYVTVYDPGITRGDVFCFYLPNTPASRLSSEFRSWSQLYRTGPLTGYALYNLTDGHAFDPE